jgi:hypothetical protein
VVSKYTTGDHYQEDCIWDVADPSFIQSCGGAVGCNLRLPMKLCGSSCRSYVSHNFCSIDEY